jgi:hypothetical protein
MKKNLEFAKAISTKYSTHKFNYWLVDSVHNPHVKIKFSNLLPVVQRRNQNQNIQRFRKM